MHIFIFYRIIITLNLENERMKRNKRHEAIKHIIATQEVSTQEELTKILNDQGFNTTQATVSRDINELNLVKVTGNIKKFKYAVKSGLDRSDKYANIFKESVIAIEVSLNILVIKTVEGSANAAAAFIDKLNLAEIIGTMAGDDTILVVAKSIESAPKIQEALKEYLK